MCKLTLNGCHDELDAVTEPVSLHRRVPAAPGPELTMPATRWDCSAPAREARAPGATQAASGSQCPMVPVPGGQGHPMETILECIGGIEFKLIIRS